MCVFCMGDLTCFMCDYTSIKPYLKSDNSGCINDC